MRGVRKYFRKPHATKFKGVTSVAATATKIELAGLDTTFKCVSGNLWVNWTTTATAAATSYKMAVGEVLELAGVVNLSVISDVSAATYEYICWE